MKHLKLFENFGDIDLISYCEDFWDVDPYFLRDVMNHDMDENSVNRIGFYFETMNRRGVNLMFMDSDGKLSIDTYHKNSWSEFFNEIERIDKKIGYPIFTLAPGTSIDGDQTHISQSEDFISSVYYKEDTKLIHNKNQFIYIPKIVVGFDLHSVTQEGEIGEWEDTFNESFRKAGIPYVFDGDNRYSYENSATYNLLHT